MVGRDNHKGSFVSVSVVKRGVDQFVKFLHPPKHLFSIVGVCRMVNV